jgi:hypothetical protein
LYRFVFELSRKTQIYFLKHSLKEWFDRYKYAELAATTAALLASQLSRIFSSLTTAYQVTSAEYFAFYSVIMGMAYWKCTKKNKAIQQKTTFRQVLMLIRTCCWNLDILQYEIFYLSVRFVCIGCLS